MSCPTTHRYQDLIVIFNQCFQQNYNTQLVKGDDEPLYLPASETQPHHTILFAHGFFSSALHECAHWLIAGKMRRLQIDYGYWYEPDGRTFEQQALFQKVEVKPQALEWILSSAAGYKFRLSIDNLNGEESNTNEFQQAVYEQVLWYCQHGLSPRASLFHKELCRFYGTSHHLQGEDFNSNILW